ncbi:DUF5998 family protein [Georgenia sp. TF02-10]|uniref:DUF5998 family protein n=1 Tax=Georgenia sp. TF02-10 TaxID=2917725 RepID=UPI001FA6DCC2|nr:DUF5998 family protein [Georgenia sp. TF02-10]UNX53388.1 DUF5998 family protein [Georgenia sp. TF02-10]
MPVTNLAQQLRSDLDHAGYYPELVAGVIDVALADEPVQSFLVHPETTFDDTEVRRHLTALVLTPTRLVVAHVDDGPGPDGRTSAAATTEAVALGEVRSVGLTHGVTEPAGRSMRTQELTLAVSWGGVANVDLQPATCGDPDCEADHGYSGLISPDDVLVRVSAAAEGGDALAAALAFARALSAATAAAGRGAAAPSVGRRA